MTRPADLAASVWADFARVRVELGVVDSWVPSGGEWDGGLWDKALWGQSYLTPNRWLDVTRDVIAVDVDTGRNGVDDPGDVGTASVTLYDPDRGLLDCRARPIGDRESAPSHRRLLRGRLVEDHVSREGHRGDGDGRSLGGELDTEGGRSPRRAALDR